MLDIQTQVQSNPLPEMLLTTLFSSMAASEEGKQETEFFEVIPPFSLLTLYPL